MHDRNLTESCLACCRKAALRFHPDKAAEGQREANEKQFKLVGEANAILSDPAKRQKYDAGWNAEEIAQVRLTAGTGEFMKRRRHSAEQRPSMVHCLFRC